MTVRPCATRASKAATRTDAAPTPAACWITCLALGTCIACGTQGSQQQGSAGWTADVAGPSGASGGVPLGGAGATSGTGGGGVGGALASGSNATGGSGTGPAAGRGTGGAGNSSAGSGGGGAGVGAGGSGGGSVAAGGSGGSDSTPAGAGGAGGGGATKTCPLPTTFKWTSGAALAQPKNGWVSLKDFSHVPFNNKHCIYMTTHDQSSWGSGMFVFNDWPDAATAVQTKTSFGVAPTVFFFTPKKIWVIAYQWGRFKFSYRTSSDPSDPNGWGSEQSLYNTALPSSGTGPIDQTVICNSAKCYLYYAGDNGHIYTSWMPIESFPGEFPAAQDSGIQGTSQNLFEAVQVYSVKGSGEYLMIVEAQGSARYFRAWTATDLDGPWMLLTDTFASKSNVTFSSSWTNDISHGDLVRASPDETFTVDPCNLQMVFQGRDPSVNTSYDLLPYRPGLLTLAE